MSGALHPSKVYSRIRTLLTSKTVASLPRDEAAASVSTGLAASSQFCFKATLCSEGTQKALVIPVLRPWKVSDKAMFHISGRLLNGIRVTCTVFGMAFFFLVMADIFRWHDSIRAVLYDAVTCLIGSSIAVWAHLALNRRRWQPLHEDNISGIAMAEIRFTNAIPQQGGNYNELAHKLNQLAQYATVPGRSPWRYDPGLHCTVLVLLNEEIEGLDYEIEAARRAVNKYAMTLRGRRFRVLVATAESVRIAKEGAPVRLES